MNEKLTAKVVSRESLHNDDYKGTILYSIAIL